MNLLNISGKLIVTHSIGSKSVQKVLRTAFKKKEAFPNTAKDIINYLKNNHSQINGIYNYSNPNIYNFSFKKAPDKTVTELFGHDVDAKWANILYVGQIPEKDIQLFEKNSRAYNKVKKIIETSKNIEFENEIFTITKVK